MKPAAHILTLFLLVGVNSRPLSEDEGPAALLSRNGPVATVDFLRKYGYLEPGSSNNTETIYSKDSIRQGIKLMQRYGGLKETGEINEDTIQLLSKPRCGVKDIVGSTSNRTRTKRYIIRGGGWHKRTLTYSLHNWSPKLGQDAAEVGMKKALDTWARHGNLKFIRRPPNSEADILISFHQGRHGDNYPFDGKGYVLAHAFYPSRSPGYGGDIHFDEAEDWWSPDGYYRNSLATPISFSSVATHELGHSLGLGHSTDQDSIMFAYYNGKLGEDPKLGYDDVLAVHKLYIERDVPEEEDDWDETRPHGHTTKRPRISSTTSRYPPTTTTMLTTMRTRNPTTVAQPTAYTPTAASTVPLTTTAKSQRTDAHPTSIPTTTMAYGSTTRGFDRRNPTTASSTTPRDYEEDDGSERNLCSGASVKITFLRNEIFVFRGQYMWRLAEIGSPPPPAYPVKIGHFFRSLAHLDRIDAAYERSKDGQLVFFSGNVYWEMDGHRPMHDSPKPLTELGLPPTLKKLDGAFTWTKNGLTYFFSGDLYWRYNDTLRQMDAGYPMRLTMWKGIPGPIDSVLSYKDGKTYFFHGDGFWRFDDVMVKAEENFPLTIKDYWLGC